MSKKKGRRQIHFFSWDDRKEGLLERERLKLRGDFIDEVNKLRGKIAFQIDMLVRAFWKAKGEGS